MAGTVILFESLSGICSCSPFQLVWVVINHYQILLLLMLCNAYFPDDILNFMKRLGGSSFSLNILNLDKVSIYKKINEALDYPTTRANLDYFEINSGSSIINHYSFYSTLMLNIVMHLLCILTYKLLKERINQFSKLSFVVERISGYFNLGFYIRIISETYLFLLLSSFTCI